MESGCVSLLIRLLPFCLLLLSTFVRSVTGGELIFCPANEMVKFDGERRLFFSDLMPGMPEIWKQLQSPSGGAYLRIISSDGLLPADYMANGWLDISFKKVSVQEYQRNSLLVSQLICHYSVRGRDGSEELIELKPQQNFLEKSRSLSFPIYLNKKKE